MKLLTERLILRKLTMKDAKDLRDSINNLNISKWLLVVPYPYTLKDAKWYIRHSNKKENDPYNFNIELKNERKIIWGAGLHRVDKKQGTAELGYWLDERYWRQGIITEAVSEIIDFGFNKLKLRRVIIPAYSDNKASNGLAKSLGFKYEGKLRKAAKCKATGKIHDENLWSLLNYEWKNAKKKIK